MVSPDIVMWIAMEMPDAKDTSHMAIAMAAPLLIRTV
jgi:hypothetical protein